MPIWTFWIEAAEEGVLEGAEEAVDECEVETELLMTHTDDQRTYEATWIEKTYEREVGGAVGVVATEDEELVELVDELVVPVDEPVDELVEPVDELDDEEPAFRQEVSPVMYLHHWQGMFDRILLTAGCNIEGSGLGNLTGAVTQGESKGGALRTEWANAWSESILSTDQLWCWHAMWGRCQWLGQSR